MIFRGVSTFADFLEAEAQDVTEAAAELGIEQGMGGAMVLQLLR